MYQNKKPVYRASIEKSVLFILKLNTEKNAVTKHVLNCNTKRTRLQ